MSLDTAKPYTSTTSIKNHLYQTFVGLANDNDNSVVFDQADLFLNLAHYVAHDQEKDALQIFLACRSTEEITQVDGIPCNTFEANLPVIEPDTPETGTIETYQGELWLFDGQKDQTITIRMDHLEGSDLDSVFTLYGPDGKYIVGDDQSGGDNNAFLEITLPKSGIYGLFARAWSTSSGDYELEVKIVE